MIEEGPRKRRQLQIISIKVAGTKAQNADVVKSDPREHLDMKRHRHIPEEIVHQEHVAEIHETLGRSHLEDGQLIFGDLVLPANVRSPLKQKHARENGRVVDRVWELPVRI